VEVDAYEHSDYIKYMVCYGVNKIKKEVYLVGVDSGGGMDTPYFECVHFEVFSSDYTQLYGFWDKSFQENAYWQEVLARILVAIYDDKVKTFYVNGFVYPKKSVFNYARKNVWELVNTNQYLLGLFNQILNED
jgi:hypothetical protein